MADNNPNKIIESLSKKPVRITNAANPNAAAPKVEQTLIHNPLTQGKTKDSPEYKAFVKDVFAKLDDYRKSPEYKKAALDAIFGKDDVDYNKFHSDLRSGFLKKYGYDEDLGKIAPGHLGGFDMEWSPIEGQNDRTLLGKKNSLTNLISGGLSLDDIRDYFTQQQKPQEIDHDNDPVYWAQRVLEEPGEYDQETLGYAKFIIDRFVPESDEWLRKVVKR